MITMSVLAAIRQADKPDITAETFDELLLECREYLFAHDEWMESSHRPERVMDALVNEFQLRYGIDFEPEPLSIYGVYL